MSNLTTSVALLLYAITRNGEEISYNKYYLVSEDCYESYCVRHEVVVVPSGGIVVLPYANVRSQLILGEVRLVLGKETPPELAFSIISSLNYGRLSSFLSETLGADFPCAPHSKEPLTPVSIVFNSNTNDGRVSFRQDCSDDKIYNVYFVKGRGGQINLNEAYLSLP